MAQPAIPQFGSLRGLLRSKRDAAEQRRPHGWRKGVGDGQLHVGVHCVRQGTDLCVALHTLTVAQTSTSAKKKTPTLGKLQISTNHHVYKSPRYRATRNHTVLWFDRR